MLRLVAPAEAPPVSLDTIKAHLNIVHDDFDALLRGYLVAAVELVEARTTRILAPATFEFRLDGWPCEPISLPAAPVRNVLTLSYIDEEGAEQSVDAAEWDWERETTGAKVWLSHLWTRPTLGRDHGAVRIGFEAGYDLPDTLESGDDFDLLLPERAVQAIKLLVGHWYRNREAGSSDTIHEIDHGAEALMRSLRIFR
ncbi:head-tail connector protein [Parvibaculum sp. MBR-TMA-1.3b-4.2]|jgi:uncharacterized phiE125 gp8 family phage protein